jgi:hypothetical protein
MIKSKNPKFKTWVVIIVSLFVLMCVGYCFARKAILNTAYDDLSPTTKKLQEQLNGGTSPNGALAYVFYGTYAADLSPHDLKEELKKQPGNASFGIVVEETKSYAASSAKLNGLNPVPPVGFLSDTKTNKSNHMIWQPAKDVRVAVHSLAYHYGDVFGYVITGQSAKPYEMKLLIYKLAFLTVWLLLAVLSYRLLLKKRQ